MSICLITGSGRSGTTSLLKAIGLSAEVKIALEPMPTLNAESRDLFDGRLDSPHAALLDSVIPRAVKALDQGFLYVEKHLSFVPFITSLHNILGCKFLIPVRDGRDVVTSLMNWHNQMFPIIYQECKDQPVLGPKAQAVLDGQVGADPFDYSLPRPRPSDPWYKDWSEFSRFEMVAWYWNFINNYLFDELEKLPPEKYLIVDYTNPSVEAIRRAYEFIGLSDFDEIKVSELLDKKVNSLADRIGESGKFPAYRDWSERMVQRFWDIAGDGMVRLGYAHEGFRPKPAHFSFGASCSSEFQAAPPMNFMEWYRHVSGDVNSVALIGDQVSAEWFKLFSGKKVFHCPCAHVFDGDADLIFEKADLVVCLGGLERAYDIDASVRKLVELSKGYVYLKVVDERNGLNSHRYAWSQENSIFENTVSAKKIELQIGNLGFASVVSMPVDAKGLDSSRVAIIASRSAMPHSELLAGHSPFFEFKDYVCKPAISSAIDIVKMVDQISNNFSAPELDLTNSYDYFASLLSDLKAINGRVLGSVESFVRHEACNTAIRLDVDIDLVAATELARIAASLDVKLSFYILHTACYYGYFYEGIFYRHVCSAEMYKKLQSLGMEVGMHIDPLGVYVEQGVDGTQAVEQELLWLRSLGLDIRGTTGHNCAPVYGAENCEIFSDSLIRKRPYFRTKGRYIPLATLDPHKLGIYYDGSRARRSNDFINPESNRYLDCLPPGDFLRSEKWFKQYIRESRYCDWGDGYHVWLLGKDSWVVSGVGENGSDVFRFDIPWAEVRTLISELSPREKVMFTLHPLYLGRRQ